MPDDATHFERIELLVDSPGGQKHTGIRDGIAMLIRLQREQEKVIANYAKMTGGAGNVAGVSGAGPAAQMAAQMKAGNAALVQETQKLESNVARVVRVRDAAGVTQTLKTKSNLGAGATLEKIQKANKEGVLTPAGSIEIQNMEQAAKIAQAEYNAQQKALKSEFQRDIKNAGGFNTAVENEDKATRKSIARNKRKDAKAEIAIEKQELAEINRARADSTLLANQMADAREARAKERYKGQLLHGQAGESQQIVQSKKEAAIEKQLWAEQKARDQSQGSRVAGKNILDNTKHIAAWASGVFLLYGSLRLAGNAMNTLMNTGSQMARLQQVLKVPMAEAASETSRLSDEIIHLAAVNGRTTSEAMESGIKWARLGYTRLQIQEAVRVSLIAANVAELSAAEATDHLSSITQVYGLRVTELGSVLGMLNQVSNTFNVTNADLFDGIARTAAIAKQAGVPLAELIGIIGAGVGSTGQTGSQIGNAFKSITGAITTPDKQKLLKDQFGFETKDSGGQLKDMSTMLADLFVAYQKMGQAEKQSMLFGVAGKTQASRMAAILDSYVRGQVLAIQAQLHLNSAEQENKLITESLKAQVAGLVTEWDRFVIKQGSNGPVEMFTQLTKAFRGFLTVLNLPGFSQATTLVGVTMTAMAAKMLLASTAIEVVGRKPGVLASTGIAMKNLAADMLASAEKINAAGWFGTGIGAKSGSTATGGAAMAAAGAAAGSAAPKVGLMAAAAVGLRAALISMAEAVPILLVAYGVFKGISSLWDAAGITSGKEGDMFASQARDAEAAQKAAAAALQTARLMKTVKEGFQNQPDKKAKQDMLNNALDAVYNTGDEEADYRKTKALKEQVGLLLEQQGGEAKIAGILDVIAGAAYNENRNKLQQEYNQLKDSEYEIQKAISELENAPIAFNRKERLSALKNAQLNNKQSQRDKQTEQLLGYEDITGAPYKTFEARHSDMVKAASDIFSEMPGNGAAAKSANEIAAAQWAINVMKAQMESLKNEEASSPGSGGIRMNKLKAQMEDQQVLMDAAMSESRSISDGIKDRNKITQSMQSARIDASSTGLPEFQFSNQDQMIRNQLNVKLQMLAVEKDLVAQDNLRQQIAVLAAAAQDSELKGETRLLEIEKENVNILAQKNREYSRGLLEAGPGDLLRRLAVNRMSAGGRMNSGSFMAMDVGARQEFLNRPENDQQIRQNNRERSALRDRNFGRTDSEIQQEWKRMGQIRNDAVKGINAPPDLINASAREAVDGFVGALVKAAQIINDSFKPRGASGSWGAPMNPGNPHDVPMWY